MTTYLHDGKVLTRFIAYSPERVEGYFRFNDVLQILSLPDEAPKPGQSFVPVYPFIIEYSFEEMDVDSVREALTAGLAPSSDVPDDQSLMSDHFRAKKQEILTLLSVITRYPIEEARPGMHWVLDTDGAGLNTKFLSDGYFWGGIDALGNWFSTPDLLEITSVESNKYYNQIGSTGEPFSLSDATPRLLENYFGLDDDAREVFLSACVLFSQSLEARSISKSLPYIGIVSSLETLIKFDNRGTKPRHCSKCDQLMYGATKKFQKFLAEYGLPEEGFKKFADDLYDRRSGIGHRGELLAGDEAGRAVPWSNEFQDNMKLLQLSCVARVCFVNWLYRER